MRGDAVARKLNVRACVLAGRQGEDHARLRIRRAGRVHRHVGLFDNGAALERPPIDRRSRIQRWRDAEALGFDGAWVADTLSLPGTVEYEAWTLLTALAQVTSRIRIGTLVTQIAFRHPALLGNQVDEDPKVREHYDDEDPRDLREP